MAVKHRKLFSTKESNQTLCTGGGDACLPAYGDYSLPLPPQDPPPPPAAVESGKNGISVSTDLTIAAVIAACLLFIVGYYLISVKNCLGLRRRPSSGEVPAAGENLDENRGPVIDHPIWYIRTIGLQPSVINSISIFRYKRGENLVEGTECSVCLNEFQDDEALRLLPKCNHAFHIRCIDTWLRSHTNCPLCRAAIVSASSSAPPQSPIPEFENREANQTEQGNSENRGEGLGEEEVVENQESNGDENYPKVEETGNNVGNNVVDMSMRRCLSVDSSSIAARMDPQASQSENERSSSRIQRMMGGGSMNRSFSYGGRSFFSRY